MSEMAMVYGKESNTLTKIEKYGWKVQDSPGELRFLHKSVIRIHPAYQRSLMQTKVREIASNWSWIACGVIVVGERGGEFWGIDGQHRVKAANQRSDIDFLPCLVFKTDGVDQEAKGFLALNTNRKPVSSIDKFRAGIASKDETAIYVDLVLREIGITPKSTANKPMEMKSVAWAMAKAKDSRESFEAVIRLASEICQASIVHEMLLEGLHYLHSNCAGGLSNKRLRDRLKKIGPEKLVESAKRASAFYARGGAKVWGEGMLIEINKGIREKVVIDGVGK